MIEIDQNAGTAQLKPFPNTSGNSINAIGYRLQDKMIYGSQGGSLVRIDGTGKGEILANIKVGSVAGDITPDGKSLVYVTFESVVLINLESGAYEVTENPFVLKKPMPSMITVDVAFNPSTGILYGFDTGLKKLVTIDPATGFVDNVRYQPIDISAGFPALFFDNYGNLWGLSGDFLYQLSTVNGQITGKIPLAYKANGRIDGCSCPGSFNFQKTAWPETISHCGVLDYIFSISNRTGQTQQHIELEDYMPNGVIIEKIVKNPFGGEIVNALGTNHLLATNLSIPEGVDSIIVRVRLDNLPTGEYRNQAVIKDIWINAAQSNSFLSDNPATHAILDSTSFFVKDLQETLYAVEEYFCSGAVLTLDASVLGGQTYTWNSGEEGNQLEVSTAGDYIASISTRCEVAEKIFHVIDATLTLDIGDDLSIQSGDTIPINPEWAGAGALSTIYWSSKPSNASLSCKDCLPTLLYPVSNTDYTLQISNEYGCIAEDNIAVEVQRSFYIPNVFAPTLPAPNNVFFIQSKNPINITYLSIFDRWGELVFERKNIATNDISAGWDGTQNNRKLSPGVFVWMAELMHANGSKEKIQGDVTLLE